jgi:hypothetical protein
MSGAPPDLERLRRALRALRRGDLLIIAERAAELVPQAQLGALLGDLVQIDAQTQANEAQANEAQAPLQAPLWKEVQKFHTAALAGKYYQDFSVNSRNFMERSAGTDAFIAEFGRLLGKCVRAADTGPPGAVREPFELLFGLLRHIDEAPDDVIFFADEAGSWQVGVDWRTVFPAYFRCLAGAATADEFATTVDRAIADFADHERPRHLAAARKVASAAQRAALRAQSAARR